ncbi:MAG: hypothetical protein PHW82_08590 [Bacteroidales bacterium]|nr:hypothetical protein [Bacteroidales bacterium]
MKFSRIIQYNCLIATFMLFQLVCKSSNNISYITNYLKNSEVQDSIIVKDSSNIDIVNIKISPLRILFGDLETNSFAIGCGFEALRKKNHSFDIGLYLLLHENIIGAIQPFPQYVKKLIGYYFYFDRKNYFLKNKEQFNSPYWSYSFETYFTFSKPGYSLESLSTYRQLSSARINIGIQKRFFESTKFIYDLNLGLGVSHLFAYSPSDATVQALTIPLFNDNYYSTYSASNILYPSIHLTIRLGYVIQE